MDGGVEIEETAKTNPEKILKLECSSSDLKNPDDARLLDYAKQLFDNDDHAQQAVDKAAAEGISCELIDLRSLLPLDSDAILKSVRKTGRCVVVHEAPKTCGFGAELCALIQERALSSLEAPGARVTGYDTPFPYALEMDYMPSPDRIRGGIDRTLDYDFLDD